MINNKNNIQKSKIKFAIYQNKIINIGKDANEENIRVIHILKIKSDLISNSSSYENLRENNTIIQL